MSAGVCRPVNSPGSCFVFIFCVPGAQVQRDLEARREALAELQTQRPLGRHAGWADQRETLEMRLSATNPGYHPRDDKAIDAIVRADAGKSPTVPTRRSVPWPLHGRCGGQLPVSGEGNRDNANTMRLRSERSLPR